MVVGFGLRSRRRLHAGNVFWPWRRIAEREAELEARTFRTGKRVKVARGRKIPIGTEGVIFWMGVDNWGKQKLGIATSDRKVGGKFADVQWVAASNCDIIRAQEAAAVA